MTTQQIKALLAPPSTEAAYSKTLTLLNSQFSSLDQLNTLDTAVEQSLRHREELNSQVRSYIKCLYKLSEFTEPS
jgi:hypothetical protein